MTKSMKKTGIIIGLASLAIYIVVKNIVMPLMTKKNISHEVIDIPGMESTSQSIQLADHALKATDIKALFWINIPQRNPFSSILKVKANEIEELRANHQAIVNEAKSITTEAVSIEPEPIPQLSGLISSKHSRLAVVNGKILAEGDSIDGYQVIQIMSHRVKLKKLNTYDTLTLTLEKK